MATTTTRKKKEVLTYQYIAKVNLPFGVKAGDIFTKNEKGFIDSKGVITPYDCSESNFFKKEELVQPMFEIGTKLLLNSNIGKRRNTRNSYFNLTKNTVFTFVKQDRIGVYVKNSSGFEYTFSVAELKKYFVGTNHYFYVSDAGTVRETYIGMNESADGYRMKIGNMFGDEKSAKENIK